MILEADKIEFFSHFIPENWLQPKVPINSTSSVDAMLVTRNNTEDPPFVYVMAKHLEINLNSFSKLSDFPNKSLILN